MSVKAILDEKGRQVYTVDPHATVRDAVEALYKNRVGAVVVTKPGDKIAGILSERDIVAGISKYGAGVLDKPVTALMTAKVHVCHEDMSVNDIMEIMNHIRARHLPVERNGQLVGIVSIGDAVRRHITAIEQEAEQIKAYIAS
ncbi:MULTISPECIES: CBS domain-containing protein [unclassified Rhizobium]|uniref:CBS domain-containing protein n=1 Tax=unclassified Rhizobium TaxID=2613769 RepID=UPI0006FBD5A6|nr:MULTISPECIES: CBS domain-containing protein [unclassified Rhizobium]KQV42535.1 inosine-5-monophosphate dehydrogenase [Rhizobium sp. Root1212]KRD21435.1 inosine-5-monophosphate dehydrogenase [Rhizobium sp. Root268]